MRAYKGRRSGICARCGTTRAGQSFVKRLEHQTLHDDHPDVIEARFQAARELIRRTSHGTEPTWNSSLTFPTV